MKRLCLTTNDTDCISLVTPVFTCSADNLAYFSFKQLDVELYTNRKQPELEEKVEAVLAQHEIYYTKTELFIDSEELYEVLYEMEV